MKKLKLFATMLLTAMAFVATGCDDPVEEPPKPEPPVELTFEINIDDVTKSTVTYSVTPTVATADYLVSVIPESVIDNVGVGAGLITEIMNNIKTAASTSGKTLAEYLPALLDRGNVSGDSIGGLAHNTDYTLVVFGVDAANNFDATTDPFCMPFTTEDIQMANCTFNVEVTVTGNTAELSVVPSDKEQLWHLFIVEKAQYDAYTDPAGNYKMSDTDFYLAYLDNEISNYINNGYTAEQIIAALFLKGDLTLSAEGMNANTDYTYMIAGLSIEEDIVYVVTEPQKDHFTSGEAAGSEMTFEIEVDNVEMNRVDLKITPSNLEETFTWVCATYDGTSTAEQLAEAWISQNKMWLDWGMMLYTGVQDYTAMGPNFKYKVDVPDSDYYVLAVGYAGGVTTAPAMATFRTLPAPDPADATFTLSYSEVTGYSFKATVDSSDETTAYFFGVTKDGEFNEEQIKSDLEAMVQEMLQMQQMYDPNATAANILASYAWKGDYVIESDATEPNTTYTTYIAAMNLDGTVAKLHVEPSAVTTPGLGSVTPTAELIGFYSGDEENGELFGQPEATAGKAICVVKYGNLDNAVKLYYSSVYDINYMDPTINSDAYVYNNCYWQECSMDIPYSFIVADWTYEFYVMAYALDINYQPAGMARLAITPTAEGKGNYSDLKALVEELNSQSTTAAPAKVMRTEIAPYETILNKKNTDSRYCGTTQSTDINSIPATIARPEMMLPELDGTTLRALNRFSIVRTK